MAKQFFTMGGSQYWEDVFFYQKWRIQRNCNSKLYRLLDNWDIRRHEGSFEECRKAFLKYIEIFEISRQKGHMVVMIHGLGESKNIFKPLWREVLRYGFLVAAINYPSTQKKLDSHVRQLEFLLNNLEDVEDVSFVTKGCGGIVLRKLMSLDSAWQKKLRIRRIIQISPPNKGSKFLGMLNKFWIFRKLLGPMIGEINADNLKYLPGFPKNIDIGIITTDFPLRGIAAYLPWFIRKNLPTREESELNGVKEVIHIPNFHINILKNSKIHKAVVAFLKNGKF